MSLLPPVRNSKEGERGFALLLVFLLAAGIALMLYSQIPRVAFESERDKEQLLIDRGEQYKRAIQEFYVAYKRYPVSIEELEHTNDKRYLRKRYVDPYTGKDEWRLVHVNVAGQLTDSLVTKPPGSPTDPNNPNKDQLAQNLGAAGGTTAGASGSPGAASGFPGPGGFGTPGGQQVAGGLPPISTFPGGVPGVPGGVPGQPPGPGDVNPAVLRRPSDRTLVPGQFNTGTPAAVLDPNNPVAANGNQPDPNNPGQTLPGQTADGQPAQAFPGQNQPGQFGQPGFQGQQPDPNNFNSLPSANFPPISLQAMQQQQGGGAQPNGQLPPGQQFPGQGIPGQVPGQPAGNQVRIGQNGQFVPVNQPFNGQQPGTQAFPGGAQPFPGAPQAFPGGPQPVAQPFGGAQPVAQSFPGQPQATDPSLGQAGGVGAGGVGQGGLQGGGTQSGAAPNSALNLINQLLTTPRQPPAGVSIGAGGTSGGALAIAGIASTHEGASVKVYKTRKKFKEWEFIFNPSENAPQAPAPTNPLGNANGTNPAASPAGANLPGSTQPGATPFPGAAAAPQSTGGTGALTIGP